MYKQRMHALGSFYDYKTHDKITDDEKMTGSNYNEKDIINRC